MSSKMTLFDAQTGQTVKVNANDCNNIASKGFKLLGKSKKMDTATQDSQKEHQKQSNPTTLSQQAAKVGEGQQVQVVANVTHRYFLRPRRAGAVVSSISTDQPWGSKDNDTMKITDPHGAIPDVGQPKAVLNPAPTAPVLSGLKTCTRSANSNKPKTELGDWLELENDLRRAQGKGPISIKRAGTEDALGCYMYVLLLAVGLVANISV